MIAHPKKGFREAIENAVMDDGYDDGPWLVKHSALYWRAWHEWNPKWVCVRRNPESVFQSCKKSKMLAPGKPDEHIKKVIALHNDEMDKIVNEKGGVNVYTDHLIQGDLSSLKRAFEYCDLELDEMKAKSFIDPAHWHYA